MRFAVSHNDASIYSYFWTNNGSPNDPVIGLKGPNGDQYLYAHTQYDVQGSYRLYKGLRVVGYGLNLSKEVFGFYQGSSAYPIQREYYHPTASRWAALDERGRVRNSYNEPASGPASIVAACRSVDGARSTHFPREGGYAMKKITGLADVAPYCCSR